MTRPIESLTKKQLSFKNKTVKEQATKSRKDTKLLIHLAKIDRKKSVSCVNS